MAIIVPAALAACSDDDKDPNKPAAEPALEVVTGQCLQVTDDLEAVVTKLPVIDCAKEHSHEIFATIEDTKDDVYPGAAALESFSETACYNAFEEYVGISVLDSSLFVSWIYPSLRSWNEEDDRSVLCVLGNENSQPLKGSVKGKKI